MPYISKLINLMKACQLSNNFSQALSTQSQAGCYIVTFDAHQIGSNNE